MKKKSIWISAVIIICLLFWLVVNCFDYGAEKRKKSVQVAISFSDTKNASTTAIWQDVLENLERQGFTVEWRDANADIEKQKHDIQELLEYEPEYLAVMPVKTIGLEERLRQADQGKAKIIMLDRLADNLEDISVLAEIRTDAMWEGEACADLLARFFDGREGKILEVRGENGSSINRMHNIGFRNQLSEYGNLEITASTEGNGDRGTARNNVMNYLLNHPGSIDAIFANTDEEGIGAVHAMEELGLREQITIVSVNGIKDVKTAIQAGGYYGCVEASPYLGRELAELIDQDMQGIQTQSSMVARGNVFTVSNLDEMQGY